MSNPVLDFYGFSRMPFGKRVASQDLFTTRNLDETLMMFSLGVEEEDVLLITGVIGCGKSVTLRSCIQALDANRYTPIYLRGTIGSLAELYRLILRELKVEPPHSISRVKPLFYATVAELSRKPVVFIDDAQDVAEEALLGLKAMVNFEKDSQNRITFVLCGQPELRTILSYSQFQSLRGRIRLAVHLSGMGLEETCAYIDHGLQIAGRPSPLFSDSAKMEIFKRTSGVMRAINTLCYQAVICGASARRDILDSTDIPEGFV
jgi:type II secretory pathway predicted ATPase ExeA